MSLALHYKNVRLILAFTVNNQLTMKKTWLSMTARNVILCNRKANCLITHLFLYSKKDKKVKWSRYRPGVAQRVGRGIALLFHDRGTRRGWVVSSTPQPHFTPRERPGTHFTGGWVGPRDGLDGRKISSPPGSRTVQPVAQSLYRLSYPAQCFCRVKTVSVQAYNS